jgi:hypothetical protein
MDLSKLLLSFSYKCATLSLKSTTIYLVAKAKSLIIIYSNLSFTSLILPPAKLIRFTFRPFFSPH